MQDKDQNTISRLRNSEAKCLPVHKILRMIKTHSPYLTNLIQKHGDIIDKLENIKGSKIQHELSYDIYNIIQQLRNGIEQQQLISLKENELYDRLRTAKSRISLLLAIAEIGRYISVRNTTKYLSIFAETVVEYSLQYFLTQCRNKGAISFKSPEESGFIILGMGKLGSHELNYSSDIDIIALYDPEKIEYLGSSSLQNEMNRLIHKVVNSLHEYTPKGYVFRVDLRLRPDPSSTPPAMKLAAAIQYYETAGQNWERAAMIKARIIAGDKETGNDFLKAIQPFMWRRHLDFAAVSDILSIKRQMNQGDDDEIGIYDHNVKTGYGGIREIEFLTQINQLLWGGREPELRIRNTIDAIDILVANEHISEQTGIELKDDYFFLRMLEHRLQMIADQQTHSLPDSKEAMIELADFMLFDDIESFISKTLDTLKRIHKHYKNSFRDEQPLHAGIYGNLVFTGVDHDPSTLRALKEMGFKQAEHVSAMIQQWHKGNRRSTRATKAREILTELVPQILHSFSKTLNPDDAFRRFDLFITSLPAGIQIFSLFNSNPKLLNLIARIMGSAPALGDILSKEPYLLDAVLTGNFYGPLPERENLLNNLHGELALSSNEEQSIEVIHRFKREHEFQVGIQLIDGIVSVEEAGYFMTNIADIVLEEIFTIVSNNFSSRYGSIKGSSLSVVTLGKMGSYEMTFSSDLDLIFVYDVDEHGRNTSDGARSVDANTYFNRLTQRFIGILTAQTRYGPIYEIDTRLRPFGKDSALAISRKALDKYYNNTAWIFERLAMNRARVIIGSDELKMRLTKSIAEYLRYPLPASYISQAIYDMRHKIHSTYNPDSNPWNIKHCKGGLMDVDFIIQYLTLNYSNEVNDISDTNDMYERLDILLKNKKISEQDYQAIIHARRLMTKLLCYLRLCGSGTLNEEEAPEGLKNIITENCDMEDFESLKNILISAEESIAQICDKFGFDKKS